MWGEKRERIAGALNEALTTGTIEQTITSLDGVVHLVSAGVVVDLPQAEAHEGHFVAAAQLDDRRRHFERSV
jgi:nicotinamide mononucleotide (NMN) deamidase PncC